MPVPGFGRPAPGEPRDLQTLADAELAAWVRACGLQFALSPRWSRARGRWRRAQYRAMRVFGERLARHAGPVPGRCDRCQMQSPAVHWAYDGPGGPRFGHFCEACSAAESPGWFVVGARGVGSAVPVS